MATTITFDCGVSEAYDHDATVTEIEDGHARVVCDCDTWSFVGPVDESVSVDDMEYFERYEGVLLAWESHVIAAAGLQRCRHFEFDDSHWLGRGEPACGDGYIPEAGRRRSGEPCEAFTAAAEPVGADVPADADDLESWVGELKREAFEQTEAAYGVAFDAVDDLASVEYRMLAIGELHRPEMAADGPICAHCSGSGNQSRVAWPCDTSKIVGTRPRERAWTVAVPDTVGAELRALASHYWAGKITHVGVYDAIERLLTEFGVPTRRSGGGSSV